MNNTKKTCMDKLIAKYWVDEFIDKYWVDLRETMNGRYLFRGDRMDSVGRVVGSYIEYAGHSYILTGEVARYPVTNAHKHLLCEGLKHYPVYPETVKQYTGLKDVEDNMIFEGDYIEDMYKKIFEVVWDQYSFKLRNGMDFWPLPDGAFRLIVIN